MAINHAEMSAILTPRSVVGGSITPRGAISGQIGAGGSGSKHYIITKTTAEWNATPQLMSEKNVMYVYSDYREETDPISGDTYYVPRAKFGDGTTYIVDLPFATMSITDEDIAKWNNATSLSVRADDESETLIFTL